MQIFCRKSVLDLRANYSHDFKQNFMFAFYFIKKIHRDITGSFPDSDTAVWEGLHALYENGVHGGSPTVWNAFQHVLTMADRSHIVSRAALYCIDQLCDTEKTKNAAYVHIKVEGIRRKRRNNRPWLWHRRNSSDIIPKKRNKVTKMLIFKYIPGLPKHGKQWSCFHAYAELQALCTRHSHEIYTLASFDWNRRNYQEDWFYYLACLEHLPQILPMAGRYPPLIEACKTKAFAPMSMIFPTLSRRACRAMHNYLKRMDAEYDSLETNWDVEMTGMILYMYIIREKHN